MGYRFTETHLNPLLAKKSYLNNSEKKTLKDWGTDAPFGSRTIRTLDYSYPPGLFVPWTVCTLLDCSYHGLFVPFLDDSYHVEKGNIV